MSAKIYRYKGTIKAEESVEAYTIGFGSQQAEMNVLRSLKEQYPDIDQKEIFGKIQARVKPIQESVLLFVEESKSSRSTIRKNDKKKKEAPQTNE